MFHRVSNTPQNFEHIWWNDLFSVYARGEKILVFRKLLRTYEMNDSYGLFEECSKTKSPENIRKTSLFNIFRGIEAN